MSHFQIFQSYVSHFQIFQSYVSHFQIFLSHVNHFQIDKILYSYLISGTSSLHIVIWIWGLLYDLYYVHMNLFLRLVSSHFLTSSQFIFHSLCVFSGFFVLSPRSFCRLLCVAIFVLIRQWEMTTRPPFHVHTFLFLDDFASFLPVWPKRAVRDSTAQVGCLSVNDKFLTHESFWSPDWNHPIRALLSDWYQVQLQPIKLVDSDSIFPLV